MNVLASEERASCGASEIHERSLLGTRIGGYTIERLLGAGGMGQVYAAVHATPEKRAVVKVLSELRGGGKKLDEAKRRFLDEARALCTLSHPNLVQLYDWGELPDGTVYILMEYVEGPSLKERMERQGGKLPQAEALEVTRQIAEALDTVHRAGIVHRDLSPYNIIVSPDPTTQLGLRIKILDFGIAKFRHEREGRTQTGDSFGTPRYMAPEQCEAASSVDDRADLYALGLLLFEMLTGESPYHVPIPTPLKWMNAHIGQRPRTLEQLAPSAPKELARLVTALLDKTADQRPGASDVVAFLASGTRIRRSLRMPKTLLGVSAGMAATALAIGSGYWMWSHSLHKSDHDNFLDSTELAALAARAPHGMALIPGGSFVMGSSHREIDSILAECERLKPEGGCHADTLERELGEHVVRLSPYYLGIYEVTNSEYAEFLNRRAPHAKVGSINGVPRNVYTEDASGRRIPLVDLYSKEWQGSQLFYIDGRFTVQPNAERLPVVQVSYAGAYEYCKNYRGWDLPTEAQWEFAAQDAGQAPQKGVFPWGQSKPSCGQTVLAKLGSDCSIAKGPAEVGTHPFDRSAHGVFDLAGNVSEWTRDVFVTPYRECDRCIDPVETDESPKTSGAMLSRVFRGGSFHLSTVAARAQGRSRRGEATVSPDIGFRCAAVAIKHP